MSNGKIEALKTRVSRLEKDVDGLAREIDSLRGIVCNKFRELEIDAARLEEERTIEIERAVAAMEA